MICSNNKRVVYVATDADILNEHYYRRLWIAAKNIEISRREWLDEIADCLRDSCDITILYPSGKTYEIPYVDDVFNDDDMRWMGLFLRANPCANLPRTRSRKLERVKLIDLYFRIKHPNIARHFGR